MNLLNALLTSVTDWLLYPVASWPLATLLLTGALTGVFMIWVYRCVSNQQALTTIVDQSRGHVLAIKLFKDDLRGMFTSLGHVLRLAAARLWYSVVPLLVMVVPLCLLLSQLALRYEYRPLQQGETAIVELHLSPDGWDSFEGTQLEPSDAIAVETPPLRDTVRNTIAWRVRPNQSGALQLKWALGPTVIDKALVVQETNRLKPVNRRRAGQGWWDRLLNPGEPAFSMFSPVSSVVIDYPRRETPLFGWAIPWWVSFFLASIIVALLLQPVFKVRF